MTTAAHMPRPWPTPWRVDDEWPVKSRARIVDAGGDQVINGMNIAKAEFIIAAVNRDSATQEMLAALRNVQKLISEAAMTGFNCKDGDWAERLFFSQQRTSAAIAKAAGAAQ